MTPFLSTIRDLTDGDPREIMPAHAMRKEVVALCLDARRDAPAKIANMKRIVPDPDNGAFSKLEKLKERLGQPMTGCDHCLCDLRVMTSARINDPEPKGAPPPSSTPQPSSAGDQSKTNTREAPP